MGGKNGIVLASHPACTFQPPETQQEQHLRFQAYSAPVINPPQKNSNPDHRCPFYTHIS